MIINDLPCLIELKDEKVVGSGENTYRNGFAFAFTSATADNFDVPKTLNEYSYRFNVSIAPSKHLARFNVSAVAGTSFSAGKGFAKSYSYSRTQSPSH